MKREKLKLTYETQTYYKRCEDYDQVLNIQCVTQKSQKQKDYIKFQVTSQQLIKQTEKNRARNGKKFNYIFP